MSKRTVYRILFSLVCTLVFVSVASAHQITIGERMRIGNGPEVQAGTYRLEVMKNQDSAEVSFFQGGNLVVTVPVTLAKEAAKWRLTEVHTEAIDGRQVITRIRLAGSTESLVFRQDAPKAD